MEQVLGELRGLSGGLRRDGRNIRWWRLLERLEYAAFLLSIGYGLMDYDPNYDALERDLEGNNPLGLVKLLKAGLEALEAGDPKKCYGNVKVVAKFIASLVGK